MTAYLDPRNVTFDHPETDAPRADTGTSRQETSMEKTYLCFGCTRGDHTSHGFGCLSADCGCEQEVSEAPLVKALPDDELDDLRYHFVNGSGAYADTKLVAKLVNEIDRLNAILAALAGSAPQPPTSWPKPDDEAAVEQLQEAIRTAYMLRESYGTWDEEARAVLAALAEPVRNPPARGDR